MDGFYWENGNNQELEKCEITITGWYYHYLLKKDKFKGDFIFLIDGESFTYYAPNISLTRASGHEGKTGVATVYDATLNQMIYLGDVIVSGNFDKFLIHSENWNIISPTESYEEAIKLAEELIE